MLYCGYCGDPITNDPPPLVIVVNESRFTDPVEVGTHNFCVLACAYNFLGDMAVHLPKVIFNPDMTPK